MKKVFTYTEAIVATLRTALKGISQKQKELHREEKRITKVLSTLGTVKHVGRKPKAKVKNPKRVAAAKARWAKVHAAEAKKIKTAKRQKKATKNAEVLEKIKKLPAGVIPAKVGVAA